MPLAALRARPAVHKGSPSRPLASIALMIARRPRRSLSRERSNESGRSTGVSVTVAQDWSDHRSWQIHCCRRAWLCRRRHRRMSLIHPLRSAFTPTSAGQGAKLPCRDESRQRIQRSESERLHTMHTPLSSRDEILDPASTWPSLLGCCRAAGLADLSLCDCSDRDALRARQRLEALSCRITRDARSAVPIACARRCSGA